MALAALLIGLLITGLGIVGLAAPETFMKMVAFFQVPPVLYLAAAIRVAFGVVLFLAAPASRARVFLRTLGVLIVIGGLLTPFIGVMLAEVIFDWWRSGGPSIVRLWAAVATVLGCLIVYAVAPGRRAA